MKESTMFPVKRFEVGEIEIRVREPGSGRVDTVRNVDYENRLYAIEYTPLIFLQPIHIRILYLYGYLNTRYTPTTYNDRVIVEYRVIGENTYYELGVYYPTEDEIYPIE